MPSKKQKLSPMAALIGELVTRVCDGNQSKFAKLAGCSQPVISRILKGDKEPGIDLVAKICRIDAVDAVDSQLLQETFNRSLRAAVDRFVVPIATTLIPGRPDMFPELVSDRGLEVSATLYRESVYAVKAIKCDPAFGREKFMFRHDDLVIIDTAVDRYAVNINGLDQRLCVIREGKSGNLTLRQVHIVHDEVDNQWKPHVRSTKNTNATHDKTTGREFRAIQLDPVESIVERDSAYEPVPLKRILGVAIQSVRKL
jgi:transcriptional regulator with XRE-family HTH domain